MDIFRVLSRGATIKSDRNRKLGSLSYSSTNSNKEQTHEEAVKEDLKLSRELDFFRNKRILTQTEAIKDEVDDHDHDQANSLKEDDSIFDTFEPKITTQEQANSLRKSYQGKVLGQDVPLPIGSFQDMITRFSFDKRLLNNLIENHFTEPTPIQSECLPLALNNRDIIACAPTGSGKTLAFLVPLIQQVIDGKKREGLKCLIISPTKELANQIYTECYKLTHKIYLGKKKPLQVALLSNSLGAKLKNKVVNDKKFDILVTTPLRLIDIVAQGALDLSSVKHLVFDEADKLFDKTFVEQTDDILAACTDPNLQKSIFSATIASNIEEIAHSIMMDPVRVIIGHKEGANNDIEQKLIFCGNEEGKLIAIRQLVQTGEFKPPILIFLESVTRAKALYHELMYDGMNIDVIHAERTPVQRQKIIENFKSGELWCLICTDVLARGIDFKGVNLVINYDVPSTARAYVHRIGRTGRGGRQGKAITFYTKQDALTIKPVINVLKQSGGSVPEWMDNISHITKRQKETIKKGKAHGPRKDISTVPKVEKIKSKQRHDMIEASKRRKIEGRPGNEV